MKNTGFTLIELSIVLVILGLIVGAIVGGKSLIRSAELQSLVRDQNNWKTAYNAFINQYDAKPGDMANAWDYFGGGGTAACGANSTDNNYGCNGFGNNIVGGESASANRRAEATRFWNHLQLAQILSGKVRFRYNSTEYQWPAPTYYSGTYFNNVPQAKQAKGDAGWTVVNTGSSFDKSGLWFMLSSTSGSCVICNPAGSLSAKEAASIDKKIDDGVPTLGIVRAMRGDSIPTSNRCSNNDWWSGSNDTAAGWGGVSFTTTANTPSTSDAYSLTISEPGCVMLFYGGDY